MSRTGDSDAGTAPDRVDRRDRHIVATGIGLFVGFVALALWAFPAVRDPALFESVCLWVCSPFIGWPAFLTAVMVCAALSVTVVRKAG